MKVVLSGLFYSMAILRYFEAALRRRDDVELYTVGLDKGYWVPWKGGMVSKTETKILPVDLPLSNGSHINPFIPISYVENRLPFKPDLWLQIDAGFYFEGRPQSGKNFIVGTDPHVLNYDRQRTYADKFFNMQKCYAKSGDEYLPYAFDPIWHAKEENVEQAFDVCFLGLAYPQRVSVINALKQKGVSVYNDLGPIYGEARHLYNQAPVSFNWSSLLDLNARAFELLGMGRLQVINRVPELKDFFEDGKDLVVFENNLPECVEKIQYYLAHKEEAQRIADQGHKTVQPHTWDARVEQLLSMI